LDLPAHYFPTIAHEIKSFCRLTLRRCVALHPEQISGVVKFYPTMERRFQAIIRALLLTTAIAGALHAQVPSAQDPAPASGETPTVLRTTVRRVVLDVVVTDPQGSPVRGLTKADFSVTEDGKPQEIIAFDANGFSSGMDYLPPVLPPQPPNTFVNMPATPEKGPLYVLLYDLVNMDSSDQMNSPEDHSAQLIARQQLIKFIQGKPEGTRFAIFVRSDGLHLIQGFTSDKALLLSAIDPHNPKPHIPVVFLMAPNFGRGDRISALDNLHAIATYLDGLPGRKNLIWFSSEFPLSLFAADTDGPNFQEETKTTLELLARDQIAVYPVDARGVPSQDSHAQLATSVHSDTITSPIEAGTGSAVGSGGGSAANSPSQTSSFVQGSSTVMNSYATMDGIARETGGRAFYSDNDVAGALAKATQDGSTYYTLEYAPTNLQYDDKLRNIHVELKRKGYDLAYRRFYYGAESPEASLPTIVDATADSVKPETGQRLVGDTLSANMQHGAPTAHQLVFVVQARRVGVPAQGTPEQMAELATEPAYFKSRRKSAAPKPLPPIPLQRHIFSFNIPKRQFEGEPSLNLELAAAVFDADGRMMNAFVRVATKDLDEKPGEPNPIPFFLVEQELEVPLAATSVRFAVRDITTDRIGAMEISLPLAPESAGP
jgi:VWFA-related protein